MLELLSPAGSPEAVIAAVQNGADAVYMGFGNFNARRGAKNFTAEEFEKAVRYCRVRGCKVYVTLNTLVGDREMKDVLETAHLASELGATGLIVQDLGMLSVVHRALPDIELHASTQMSIHNLAGVEAAAQMGMTRAVLARELSAEQIKYISKNAPIETEVFVHGALCFCHSGQCYMSSLIGRRSGNRGMCAQPCRMEYSMGARLEDAYPLSLKDNCLIDRMGELEDAGVACVKIEGRMKRPEYTAIVTGVYSKVIREKRKPTPDERALLESVFSRQGFTQGYYTGDKSDMFGVRAEADKDTERLYAEARRSYTDSEQRRVPVQFFAVVNAKQAMRAAAVDADGNKVVAFGAEPQKAIRQPTSENALNEQLIKTGGTPYLCTEAKSRIEPGLYVPASTVNELRRKLVAALNEKRAAPPQRRTLPIPEMPKGSLPIADPVRIYQVLTLEQLSDELAELKPDYLYVPVTELHRSLEPVKKFVENGTKIVCTLPRVITDSQEDAVRDMLEELFDEGISEALVGNIGHIKLARKAGMKIRADFGMNLFNSYTLDILRQMSFESVTASFEMRLAQVRDLAKTVNTELIVYGRLPLMVTEQCIISRASGSCTCANPAQLSDRMGSVFPVVREFEHRNVIYNAHKLFMADKKDDIYSSGVWGARLMFTTESARECVEVARCYRGEGEYRPGVLTRGLYYRGVD